LNVYLLSTLLRHVLFFYLCEKCNYFCGKFIGYDIRKFRTVSMLATTCNIHKRVGQGVFQMSHHTALQQVVSNCHQPKSLRKLSHGQRIFCEREEGGGRLRETFFESQLFHISAGFTSFLIGHIVINDCRKL
jgi:hypothetical protein